MNKLIIIGNLTKDPELRTTTAGVSVCSFTVAVNRPSKKGEEQKTDYFRVTAWRERGETCAKYLSKGRKVCVTGPVSVQTWAKDGKSGANLELLAESVEFLSPRTETEQAAPAPKIDEESGMEQVEEVDDLPF